MSIEIQGRLDGITLLRFAHAFDSGGGTESYLDDIDGELLKRNAMSIIRLHITRATRRSPPDETSIGRGRLIRVRLPIAAQSGMRTSSGELSLRFKVKQKFRNWVLYNPLVWKTVGARWAATCQLQRRPGEAVEAGIAAEELMSANRINLLMLHFFGGADADEIVNQARINRVPFAVVNHYSNDRFLHLAMRKHAMLADGVAGVNGLHVPRYLRHRFCNLSDGIDTEFFRRANALAIADLPPEPIILLPARLIREKGQLDLVRAVRMLHDAGLKCSVVFAGRIDTSEFHRELRNEIALARVSESVRFLGPISAQTLRDWYAASSAVAFPTYHHEGLPRVIIEAQAMETPVVAYATGGVPDAIVTGTNGLLVETGNVGALTKGLHQLLSSPTLRSSIATRGRQTVEQYFNLNALAGRHEEFYHQILSNASHSELQTET